MAADSLKIVSDGLSGSELSIVQRKIDFHQERRNFNRFNNGGQNFGRKTINQRSSNYQRQGPEPNLNGKKRDRSEGLEMDPELSFQITFRKIGAGLANLGNTCFLNSVLQCLTYTEPLAAYLQSGKHQTSCRTAGFCALCAIQKHVSRALQSTGRILAPKEIVSNLRCISRSFRNSRQEDAHEYMVNLLESMHKCCIPSGVPSESPVAYDKSLVHKIFGGRLRSQVKCTQCSFSSNKYDPFIDLSLEIVKADSLSKALGHFTAKEQLDGGERQYQCQRCKQKVRADKQLTIHKAPYVLTIHLKRFSSYLVGQKIDKKIHFGPTLDLKPFVTDPYDVDLKYTLYGVLVHAGWSTHSGHYYCFVRTSSGMWYSLDDNQVVQVSERKVLEQKAYMLFYYRNKRDVGSQKSAEQRENIARNVMGRITYSSPKQEPKEAIQSEQIDTRLNNKASSVAVAQRDSYSAALLPKTSVIDFPSEVSHLTTAENSAPNKDPLLGISSRLPALMDSLKGFPVKHREDRDSMAQQDSSAVGSLKLQSVMSTSSDRNSREDTVSGAGNYSMNSGSKMPDCKSYSSTEKGLDNLIAILPNCYSPQRSHEVTSMKDDSLKNDREALAFSASMSTKGKILPLLSSSPIQREKCYGIRDVISTKLPGLPLAKLVPIQQNALAGKPIKRPKLKLPNCPMMKMQLSSKIFIGTSSRMRRKKHKRNKKCVSESRHVDNKNLMDVNGIPSDLGMSSSKPFVSTTTSQRKGKEPLSKKKQKSEINSLETNSNGDFLTSVTHKEVGKGVIQNFAMVAEQSPKSCKTGSAGNQWDDRGTNNSKDRSKELMRNDLMGMLPRGLEETTIASWDETECSSLLMKDISRADFAIGYVAYEWDKEYDRGKRKKMRSFKNDFSGRNPFQEIAIMDTKRARIDQSSSGSRPFRIQ